MAKQLLFDDETRRKIHAGVVKLARAVKVTLGPSGRNVIFQKSMSGPTVTKDGVTVSKEVELTDPFENMGAKLVNEVASKMGDKAGDGTTTAIVLAEAIYTAGLKFVAAGASPTALKRGIDKAVDAAVAVLKSLAKPVQGLDGLIQVASISANNDAAVGEIIAKALDAVGKEGVVTVEDAKGVETTYDVVKGMSFDKGYISPYFVTDPGKMTAELSDALVFVYEKKISNVRDLLPLLEKVAQKAEPLLIVAEDVDGEALSALVINKLRGVLNCVAVKAPGFGDRRKEMLSDLATLTGGTFIADDTGRTLESVTLADLGRARKVVVKKDETVVIDGQGKKAEITARAEQIRTKLSTTTSDYDREKLQERLAKLTGGVAVIRVGAATEKEMAEKKYRVDDAMHAARAAREEGIVAGGGTALLRCVEAVEAARRKARGDEAFGVDVILSALRAPCAQIAENAGADGMVVVDEVLSLPQNRAHWGFDARRGETVDLLKAGIVDPVKVTRLALEYAASVASLMLMTNTTITSIKEEQDAVSGAIA
ncbi:MAG TPA: chaperonin GroEL [Planctomycetota bacterium]|nr:chaperonin GroEL [Planctomycetota bacterium]